MRNQPAQWTKYELDPASLEIGTGVEDVMGSRNRICVLDGGHGMVLAFGKEESAPVAHLYGLLPSNGAMDASVCSRDSTL